MLLNCILYNGLNDKSHVNVYITTMGKKPMERGIYVSIDGRLENADHTEDNLKIWTEYEIYLIGGLKL